VQSADPLICLLLPVKPLTMVAAGLLQGGSGAQPKQHGRREQPATAPLRLALWAAGWQQAV
jgi:hypothetical protein